MVHGFTTREGGVSTGPLSSLHLAHREGEDPAHLEENWRRVATALAPHLDPSRVAVLHQVHGADVVRVTEPPGHDAPVASADASYTTEPDIVLAVRVADCVPVLVAGDGVVGAAHAGWRGVAAGVVPALIEAMRSTGAGPLSAAIGPCIHPDAFEVGTEVVEGLLEAGIPRDVVVHHLGPRGRPQVDLVACVAHHLRAAGVEVVDVVDRCTASDPRMYSHRRDGPTTGRSAGVIARIA
ncbi:MAG: peptidoglycan editing factor PgeF [Alphaproteobacteria bacterium]|nr:peptidoglycan editing factor PgeF [Alphaproteobacteria bacterium]MCB9697765.1 peptidoglycan editing factor PgeF [Alphaproteobacteria bacterium]